MYQYETLSQQQLDAFALDLARQAFPTITTESTLRPIGHQMRRVRQNPRRGRDYGRRSLDTSKFDGLPRHSAG